jgi:hypothetical protein
VRSFIFTEFVLKILFFRIIETLKLKDLKLEKTYSKPGYMLEFPPPLRCFEFAGLGWWSQFCWVG